MNIQWWKRLLSVFAVEYSPVSHAEKLASILGGFAGIFSILWGSSYFLDASDVPLIVASMGASAVLVFGVPHGQLSQPWSVLGGHLVSGGIGVTCGAHISDPFFAAAAAVGLAIGAMHYLRCLHPPGGATALVAVIGGPSVTNLGYKFLLTPVLINVVIILAAAIIVNYFFSWRRYPAGLMKREAPTPRRDDADAADVLPITREDLVHAIRQIDAVIDVSETDLEKVYTLAMHHSNRQRLGPADIKLGHWYSNGRYGEEWSVRQIVDESPYDEATGSQVIYKVVAGKNRRNSAACSREEFSVWAKYEVCLNENSWLRVQRES